MSQVIDAERCTMAEEAYIFLVVIANPLVGYKVGRGHFAIIQHSGTPCTK